MASTFRLAAIRIAHELAHANDIRRKFADRNVTTGQIIMFGLTGGLIPCPAAITVLLLCLQLKQFHAWRWACAVLLDSLAITLVTVGAAAALSVRHASKRFSWFGTVARRAPYLSSVLIILVGLYVAYQGWPASPSMRCERASATIRSLSWPCSTGAAGLPGGVFVERRHCELQALDSVETLPKCR